MLKDNWLERQIATVKELITQGTELARERKLVGAEAKLKEAEIILDSAEVIERRVLQLRATVYNELGMIATNTHDPRTAAGYHKQAVEALALITDETDDHPPRLAASILNYGGALAAIGELTEAEKANRRALDVLASVSSDDPNIALMKLGAYQNLGIVLLNSERAGEGMTTLDRASEIAQELVEAGHDGVKHSLVHILLNSAVAQHKCEVFDKAIDVGQRAADLARELHEQTGQTSVMQLFLTAQMNLVSFCEDAGRFDDAEDALFKVLDVVPGHPDVVTRGERFYTSLLEKSDEELEAGGLPREEVEESLSELREMDVEDN